MITIATRLTKTLQLPVILLDFSAILLVYFMPALSHVLQFPVYLIEPMRIAVILAVMHTRPFNAYFLALTLPLFSFAISAHPLFYKALLISVELALNVWLFLYFKDKVGKLALALALSVVLSKLVYYFIKALFIIMLLLPEGPLMSTPIWVQAATLTAFCLYAWLIQYRRKRDEAAQ